MSCGIDLVFSFATINELKNINFDLEGVTQIQ